MKHLKKLLLINWHYFSIEEISFSRINFLTGKNAAGKSTIIDAMQLLFLGDTNGIFFNKAANGRSERSLIGYLRGELGDDGNSGFRYLRNRRFTSYIVGEFYDDIKKSDFSAGCCFDYYSENDYSHKFFIFDGPIPENKFVASGTPFEIKELRAFIKGNYKPGRYELPDSNKDFRSKLYSKFGGLGDRFSDLLKKAVPFAPINNIQDFITQFVCNEARPVDVRIMQDNIRHYKDLEHEATVLGEKVNALQDIRTVYDSYSGFIEQEHLHDYTVSRAEVQKYIKECELYKNTVAKNEENIKKLNNEITSLSEIKSEIDEQRIAKEIDLQSSSAQQTLNRLKNQEGQLSKKINDISRECDYVKANIRKYGISWRGILEEKPDMFNLARIDGLKEDLYSDVEDIIVMASTCKADAEVLLSANTEFLLALGKQGLVRIKEGIERLKTLSDSLGRSFVREFEILSRRKGNLEATEADLQKGIKPFDSAVVTLKERIGLELSEKYGKKIEANIFSELIDIRDERWRNAIEGYLHTQKFYILVEPEYFQEALKIYERIKHESRIYDVGLVDMEKILRKGPRVAAGSLANEITTNNILARAYTDYLMGTVIKCDRVEDLRNHERAITDGGMLYQGYVARQMNPGRWDNPYIGRHAIERQLERVRGEICAYREQIHYCSHMTQRLKPLVGLELINQNDIDRTLNALEMESEIFSLEIQLHAVEKEMAGIDKSYIDKLQKIIDELKEQIKKYEIEIETKNKEIGGCKQFNQEKTEETIPKLSETISELHKKLDERFDEDWIRETGYPKYYREINARPNPEDVMNVFGQQWRRAANQSQEK